MKRIVAGCAVLALVAAVGGCAHAWRTKRELPGEFQIVREQLVLHSDFPLPVHHRLIEELLARRSDLCRHLELPASDEPIDIYLFDTSEAFTSFIKRQYPQFPARRAFFVETDTRLTIYASWGDQVATDLRHETAHGHLHSVVPNIPLWLDEGLAEYYETPRGNQGWNAEHVAWLRKQMATDRWRPSLARLEQLPATADMTDANYAEAWLWVHWLLHSSGTSRQALGAYLADLRRDERAQPLSARLQGLTEVPERFLMDYARTLTAGDGARPPGDPSS